MLVLIKHKRIVSVVVLACMAGVAWQFSGRPVKTSEIQPPNKGLDIWLHAGMGDGAQSAKVLKSSGGLDSTRATPCENRTIGALSVDEGGNLKLDSGVRELFDFYMSGSTGESAAHIRQRIQACVSTRLAADAEAKLMAVYDKYANYRQHLDTVEGASESASLEQMKSHLDAVRRMRAEMLGSEIEQAFFGDEEISSDYALSAISRARKLFELRNGALGDSSAAAQLESLNEQDAQWDARVDQYMNRRALVQQDKSLSDAVKQQRIQNLRQSSFMKDEQLRVMARERIRDSSPISP